jgi:secreted trypsin-like serine protease
MRVYIGNSVNTFQYELGVSQVATHPNWDPNFQQTNNLANDIALLRLSSSAPSSVTPIPYLSSSMALASADINTRTSRSWDFGLTETGASGTKLKMSQPLFNICDGPNACNVNIPYVGYAQVPPNTIGIRMNSSGGICSGDSGGPALVTRSGTEYVAGINSFELQNTENECDYFGAATKVDRFNSFIANFLGITAENCSNSVDADNDGIVDCNDPDCASDAACRPTSCQMAQVIGCGSAISGSTLDGVAAYASYGNNCTGGYAMSGPEVIFKVFAGTGTQLRPA